MTSNVSKKSIRNLHQYKDLSDAEFEEIYAKLLLDTIPVKAFENRIKLKLAQFEEDYDLSDMKFNDFETLRALCQAVIKLEDLEQASYKDIATGIGDENIVLMQKMNSMMSDLRRDISKMQDDLKITRKIRKSDKEESVIAFIDDLKTKAQKFYESKMFYVYCPECKELLFTGWFLYPELKTNKLKLYCKRKPDGKKACGTLVEISSKDLLDAKGKNLDEMLDF